jgi:hypothetical protein
VLQMSTTFDQVLNPADIEQQLLAPNQGIFEMATEEERRNIKQLVSQDISTDAAANSSNEYSPDLDHSGFGAVVVDQGAARIDNVLSQSATINLRSYVDQQLLDSIQEVESFRSPRMNLFGNVLAKKSRWDLLLPFEESSAMIDALDEIIGEGSMVGSVIDSTLGKDAELYELGALISDPQSDRQEIHPDIEYQDALIPLLTCFVALQDVDITMGPTCFLPGTHKSSSCHDELNGNTERRNDFLKRTPSKLSTLNSGGASIFNPCTMHAGGSNQSDRRRCLLYITFRNTAFEDPSTNYNPGSIRPELKERRINLTEMREIITSEKSTPRLNH